jgi:hypothetical protein
VLSRVGEQGQRLLLLRGRARREQFREVVLLDLRSLLLQLRADHAVVGLENLQLVQPYLRACELCVLASLQQGVRLRVSSFERGEHQGFELLRRTRQVLGALDERGVAVRRRTRYGRGRNRELAAGPDRRQARHLIRGARVEVERAPHAADVPAGPDLVEVDLRVQAEGLQERVRPNAEPLLLLWCCELR